MEDNSIVNDFYFLWPPVGLCAQKSTAVRSYLTYKIFGLTYPIKYKREIIKTIFITEQPAVT